MVHFLEGHVSRRLLVNFRVEPEAAAKLVPAPVEPLLQRGMAVLSVSLVRLAEVRARGIGPVVAGSIETMAHRVAVTAPGEAGRRTRGVFVLRRETDSRLVATLGAAFFARDNRVARFDIEEDERHLRLLARTEDGLGDVEVECEWGSAFRATPAFGSLDEAARFILSCDEGFRGGAAPPVQPRRARWRVEPVGVIKGWSRYFEQEELLPRGSVELDGAIVMRDDAREWVAARRLPELFPDRLPQPA